MHKHKLLVLGVMKLSAYICLLFNIMARIRFDAFSYY